jgi:hypothetical protein
MSFVYSSTKVWSIRHVRYSAEVVPGSVHEGILEAVLHALNALDLPDSSACGATILSVMASYGTFNP